jgi:hypothetical protein
MTLERHIESGQGPVPVSAEDLLARLRNGTKDVYDLDFRGTKIPVRVLTVDEVAAIRREGKRQAAITGGDDTDANLEVQKAALRLATTLSKGGVPFLGDKVLGLLTIDEIAYLYDEFIAVMDRVNPALEHISPDQFRALVDALKKKTVSASDLSLRQLKVICVAYTDLVLRLDQAQHADNSSGG